MEKMSIERSIWIDAPRERVWQAMTEPQQIAQWFLPAMPGVRYAPGVPGLTARLDTPLGRHLLV